MRQPFAMFKFFPVVIYLCIFKVRASDQIYNIEDEDDEIKAKFDEYTLVSEDQRPSTICPVSFIVLRSLKRGRCQRIGLWTRFTKRAWRLKPLRP